MMQGPPQQFGQGFWQPMLQRLQAQRGAPQQRMGDGRGMPQGGPQGFQVPPWMQRGGPQQGGPQPGMGGQGGPQPVAAGMRPMFDRPQGAPMQLQAAGGPSPQVADQPAQPNADALQNAAFKQALAAQAQGRRPY